MGAKEGRATQRWWCERILDCSIVLLTSLMDGLICSVGMREGWSSQLPDGLTRANNIIQSRQHLRRNVYESYYIKDITKIQAKYILSQ